MPRAQSTESSEPNLPPLREWTYMVQLIGRSWAGTYGNNAFIPKSSRSGDGALVGTGGGEEGRITGGVETGYTEAEIREKLNGLYVLKEKRIDNEGNEQEIVTQTYRLLSLEPRTVVSLM